MSVKKFKKIGYLPKTFEVEGTSASVAIIIPYRDRKEHLMRFLAHISRLDPHSTKYDIYVVEQDNSEKFNRGLLLDIGYLAAHKINNYDRYIFHDVDSYPDQTLFSQYGLFMDKNIHYASPRLGYKYNYERFVGGVIGMMSSDFEKINGFSTIFFGWGGEDDSFYTRMVKKSVPLFRPSVGRYELAEHASPTDAEYNMNRRKNIEYDSTHWKTNGLKQLATSQSPNLNYKLLGESEFFGTTDIHSPIPKLISPHIRCFFAKAQFSIINFAASDRKSPRTMKTTPKTRKSRKTKSARKRPSKSI